LVADGGEFLLKASEYYDVFGIDIDPDRMETAREKLGVIRGEKIFAFGEIDEAAFAGKFDVIHTNQNLEHLTEPVKYLKKFAEWLKPGGLLFISCPASDSFVFSFLGKHNSMLAVPHVSMFNRRSLSRALSEAGLELKEYRNVTLDLSGLEFIKRILGIKFIHRQSYIESTVLILCLYPPVLVITAFLHVLKRFNIIKGNYFEGEAVKNDS
jgi:SAM-dependent methyltransferase